jgi:hypothetical protein
MRVLGVIAAVGIVFLTWTCVPAQETKSGSGANGTDMLALADGFGQFASRSRVVILRPDGGKMKRIPFNFINAVSEGGEQENFYLQPGDSVVVP